MPFDPDPLLLIGNHLSSQTQWKVFYFGVKFMHRTNVLLKYNVSPFYIKSGQLISNKKMKKTDRWTSHNFNRVTVNVQI